METYKQINEYPDYEISDMGNIRNIKTKRILKPQTSRKGYFRVSLYKNKKLYIVEIHRLVAITYIENLDMSNQVDHIDRNRLNNNISNLRWLSKEDNLKNRVFNKPMIYYCDITNSFYLKINDCVTKYTDIDMACKGLLNYINS